MDSADALVLAGNITVGISAPDATARFITEQGGPLKIIGNTFQNRARAGLGHPGAIVGRMLAEWLVGFDGMGGVLSGYKGAGNYGGVWTIVALSELVSIVLYEVATVVEAAVLVRWGPNAGLAPR